MILNAIKSISNFDVELIAFSDDLDGLRKVPDNVPNQDMLEEKSSQASNVHSRSIWYG